MSRNRDLFDIRNVGEFAFAMCVMGVLLAIFAFVAAFFVLELIGAGERWHLFLVSAVFWLLLNVPLYRSLERKARHWAGERRATRQIVYVETCSMIMLAGLSFLAGDSIGARELVMVLKYFFSFWILALLAYQVLVHRALRYRIFMRDAVRWCVIVAFTLFNLYAERF